MERIEDKVEEISQKATKNQNDRKQKKTQNNQKTNLIWEVKNLNNGVKMECRRRWNAEVTT